MKELVVVPEFHIYGALDTEGLILKEIGKLQKLDVSTLDENSLFALKIRIEVYYGSSGDVLGSLRGEVNSATTFKVYDRAAKTKPDTLFLEMLGKPYIEKACENFNETHNVEKVFEALSGHLLAYWVQTHFDLIRKYKEFFDTLDERQKSILINPGKLFEEAMKLKRALYQRWHDDFGKLLKIIERVYIVRTGDTKAMIQRILEKKQFFKKAAIICGADHAADFYELKDLFKENEIVLSYSKSAEEFVVGLLNDRRSKGKED